MATPRCGDAPRRARSRRGSRQVIPVMRVASPQTGCRRRTCIVMSVTVCAQPQAASIVECANRCLRRDLPASFSVPARHITSPGLPDLVPLGRALFGRPAREGSLVTDTSEIAPADPAAGGGPRTGSLSALRLPELQAVAAQLGISGTARMRKSDLVEAIKARQSGRSAAPAADTAPAGSAPSNGAPTSSTPAPRPAPRTRGRRAGAPAGPPAPRAAENGGPESGAAESGAAESGAAESGAADSASENGAADA